MRKLTKSISFLLAAIMVLSFAGCSKEDKKAASKGRILYDKVNLSDYMTIGKYSEFKIDSESENYKKQYDAELDEDIKVYDLYTKVTEGKINEGDTANIDYVGKKDGVAFQGGSAEKTDLVIGSHQFIPGFEEGLVGKEIGTTVDLNLTFPEEYHEKTLAGAAVVFTVKINSAKKTMNTAESAEKLKFKSEQEYIDSIRKRTDKAMILDMLCDSAKIKKYPAEDIEIMKKAAVKQVETMLAQQGGNLDMYLQMQGTTKEKFEEDIVKQQVKPMMKLQMPVYYVIDKENLKLTKKDIEYHIDKTLKLFDGQKVTKDMLKSMYGDEFFEFMAAQEIVQDYLYSKIK